MNTSGNVEGQGNASQPSLIRLGCCFCERIDADGIESFPTDWTDILPVTRKGLGIWETHLGICPNCKDSDTYNGGSGDDSAPWEDPTPTALENIHPIIRQIIDRDCHVSLPASEVVRHVVSKLKNGYDSLRSMNLEERGLFVSQCVTQHRRNLKEYVEVMSGFTRTIGLDVEALGGKLSGAEVVRLMRKHRMTIEQLAFVLGSTQKRIRQVRSQGLKDPLAVRDWIQAITKIDPGPIPTGVTFSDEVDCTFCGIPIHPFEAAFQYVGRVFCSTTCCRKINNW